MEITGKIINVLPERGGVSQRTGTPWKVGSYVIETIEQYPKKCLFEVFGEDRIKQFNVQVGQMLKVSFDIDAHEYNGRWFNGIRAWKVEPWDPNAPVEMPAMGAQPVMGAAPAAAPFPSATPDDPFAAAPAATAAPAGDADLGSPTDDLPF